MSTFNDKSYNQMTPFMLTAAIAASGWQGETFDWEYSGTANVIRVMGDAAGADVTNLYTTGLKLKWNDGSDKYGYAGSASYGTATNIHLVPNSDYALSGSAIAGAAVSRVAMPVGFPEWFNYAPTLTGWGTAPTTAFYRFNMIGHQVMAVISQGAGGASNGTVAQISLPVAAKSTSYLYWGGANNFIFDNGMITTGASRWNIPGGTFDETIASFYTNMGAGGWTASGDKRIFATLFYEAG
jgi:hypothetical protein